MTHWLNLQRSIYLALNFKRGEEWALKHKHQEISWEVFAKNLRNIKIKQRLLRFVDSMTSYVLITVALLIRGLLTSHTQQHGCTHVVTVVDSPNQYSEMKRKKILMQNWFWLHPGVLHCSQSCKKMGQKGSFDGSTERRKYAQVFKGTADIAILSGSQKVLK